MLGCTERPKSLRNFRSMCTFTNLAAESITNADGLWDKHPYSRLLLGRYAVEMSGGTMDTLTEIIRG